MVTEIENNQEQQLFDLIDEHFRSQGHIAFYAGEWCYGQGVNRHLRWSGDGGWIKVQYQILKVEFDGLGDRFKIPLWEVTAEKGMDLKWPLTSEAETLIVCIPNWQRLTDYAESFNEHYAEQENLLPVDAECCCLQIPMLLFQHAIAGWISDGFPSKPGSGSARVDINPMDLFFIHKESFTLEVQP